MKKSNAKEKICGLDSYAALAVLTVAACWFFAGRYGVFGANMDWISQHSVFPEYFRQQFYQTGQFFPEYAANIGGGQNIYNFSYYGLYNPIVLIAYLLPFAKMSDYLMAASVICLAASVCLLYGWLKKRRFSTEIALGVAVLFLLAGTIAKCFHLSPEAVRIAEQILHCFAVTSLFIWPLSFTLSNALRAAGDATFTMIVSIASMWIFRVGSSYFFGIVLQMGVLGIWIGMFVDWGARSALFGWRFLSGKWLQRKALA